MARIFVVDGREIPDPDPKLTVDQVRQHLAGFFPELSNAESKPSKKGKDDVFTFIKKVGAKGRALETVNIVVINYKGLPTKIAAFRDSMAAKVFFEKETGRPWSTSGSAEDDYAGSDIHIDMPIR